MFSKLSASDMAFLFCNVLSLVVAGMLFFSYRDKKLAVKWLALSFLMLTSSLVVVFLFRSGLILEFPHFYRSSLVCSLLYGPFIYLYVRTVVTQKKARSSDWLLGIPALLLLVDYAPFFLSGAEYKLSILNRSAGDPMFDMSWGIFFSDAFYKSLLPVSDGAYLLASIVRIIRSARHPGFLAGYQNAYWMRWFFFFLTFQFLMLFPVYLFYLTNQAATFLNFGYVFGVMNCAFICISFFIHPSLVEENRGGFILPAGSIKPLQESVLVRQEEPVINVQEPADHSANAAIAHPRHTRPLEKLSRKQISQMKYDVNIFLERQQSYLRHGYSLQELATSLSIPLYQLSALINQEYGCNFSDFINKYRIGYAVRIIKEGKSGHLNINGLADQCGFNNRNSFGTAFKKFTGVTPSQYFKEHKS